MKEIYLHIGYHKTGTSSLQECLNKNRSKLLKSGAWYPKSILGFPAQQEISWSLIKNPKPWMVLDNSPDEIYDNILGEFERQQANKLILSSEDLTFLESQPEGMKYLRERLSGYKVFIVAYVRNPIDFLLSLYGHRLRVGEVDLPFVDYLTAKMNLRIAYFVDRLAKWEKEFGRERMIVRNYKPSEFVGGSIVSDFLNAIKLDGLELGLSKRSNESIHPWLASTCLNVVQSMNEVERSEILKDLVKLGKRLPRASAAEHYLTEKDKSLLQSVFKDPNKRLKNRYAVEFD